MFVRSFLLLALVALTPAAALAQEAPAQATPGHLLVAWDDLPEGLQVGDMLLGGRVVDVNVALGHVEIEVPDAERAAFQAQALEGVRWLEPVAREPLLLLADDGTPNDPHAAEQPDLAQIGAPLAWRLSTGSVDAAVCILDTGVHLAHEDLDEARWLGWADMVNGSATPFDDQGHGTHVAGTAAAGVDNGVGIAGMGNVGLYGVKVLDHAGSGTNAGVARGITWCADHTIPRTVISMSLGGPTYSRAVDEAVQYAASKGKLLVGAAGNNGCDDCVGFPGRLEPVIAVGCTSPTRDVCKFSSRGPEVDLAAPGERILSTVPPEDCRLCDESGYRRASGTSMSTPHVSGAAALWWSQHPDEDAAGVRARLLDTALDLGERGVDTRFGHGELDLACLFEAPGCAHGRAPEPDTPQPGTPAPTPEPTPEPTPPPATPPRHDRIRDAQRARGEFDLAFNLSHATLEEGEPRPCDGFDRTVWARWTPSATGRHRLSAEATGLDLALALHQGRTRELEPIACASTRAPTSAILEVDAVEGRTYYVQVGAAGNASGQATLRAAGLAPPHDDPAAPLPLDGAHALATHPLGFATLGAGEPEPCRRAPHAVWYAWRAPADGRVLLEQEGRSRIVFAVHEAAPSASSLACGTRRVEFEARANVTYYMQAGARSDDAELSLRLDQAPAGDDFTAARAVAALPFDAEVDTRGATREAREPSGCGRPEATVWFTWTAPADGLVQASTLGSDFDTTLAVHTGAERLRRVACDDDGPQGDQAVVTFHAVAGETYHLQAGGHRDDTGTLRLRVVSVGG